MIKRCVINIADDGMQAKSEDRILRNGAPVETCRMKVAINATDALEEAGQKTERMGSHAVFQSAC